MTVVGSATTPFIHQRALQTLHIYSIFRIYTCIYFYLSHFPLVAYMSLKFLNGPVLESVQLIASHYQTYLVASHLLDPGVITATQ